jgi:cytochrome bd ubiquinol oxidase subunit II
MDINWWLPVIWASLIGISVALYVVLDGFDLGTGILFPFADDRERDQMMRSIAPFWDGNETWLVMGGVGLLVAFPRAYAIIMPALYLPVIVMLLALVFRGVAFEFRALARRTGFWTSAFAGGSAVAAFAQGVILGGLIQGIEVTNGEFSGGSFAWATPFAILCGFGVATGHAFLGATWLIMKTEGEIAARARRHAKMLLVAVLLFMAAVSLWTPLAIAPVAERWFSWPNIAFLWPVPIVTATVAMLAWRWLGEGGEVRPFFAAVALFLLGYLGLVISTFPYLVPRQLTIWQTAAAPASQMFILVGTLILLPLILAYTVMIYWLFRGKVRAGEGYH